MAIIINIKEENNRLDFSEPYSPIVCGNTNYKIKFDFGEEWASCNKKTAFFIIDANKLTVDFEGDELDVPNLPNAAYVMLSLISAVGEKELATTPIKIRLVPTVAGGDYSEFNQLTNYLTKVLGAINNIENGNITAKTAQNVSNPNLLINGDFRINQRGSTTYSDNGKYTVDRWQLLYGSLTANSDGSVTHTSTNTWQGIRQYIEFPSRLAGKTVTFSMKSTSTLPKLAQLSLFKNGSNTTTTLAKSATVQGDEKITTFTTTLPNDITDEDKLSVILYTTQANQSVTYYWAKLEVGKTPTEFIPRLYGEELSLCQRYYLKIRISGNAITASSTSNLYPSVPIPVPIRIKGTLTITTMPYIRSNSQNIQASSVVLNTIYDNCAVLEIARTQADLTASGLYATANGQAVIDAEIY